jgi:hypothetical protein
MEVSVHTKSEQYTDYMSKDGQRSPKARELVQDDVESGRGSDR